VASMGRVGCTQHEHCTVEGGVSLSETFETRRLPDTDAREEALSTVLNQWRVQSCEEKTC